MPAQKQKKIGPEKWNSVELQSVENLPNGIDGLSAYVMKTTNNKDVIYSLRDGRKWCKNCPSYWKGHVRVRYADCKGSYHCVQDNCPYKIEYGVTNRTQFEGDNLCKACGCRGEFVPCEARRYISYTEKNTKVYHYGHHSCPVIMKKTGKNKEKIEELVKNNPNIKPSEVQSSIIFSAYRQRMDWQSLQKKAESVVNRKSISNVKQKLKEETEPYGHNFEALVNFKEY